MNSNSNETILIIGASARYIAQSAKIAGMNPIAIDLFADWDLQEIADVRPVKTLFKIDAAELKSIRPVVSRFLIGGGMEVRAEILRCLEPVFAFLGPDIDQIEQTQDPFVVSSFCERNRISFPPIRAWQNPPDEKETTWLIKPQLGTGGHRIKHWKPGLTNPPNCFFQQSVKGTSHSALFANNGSEVTLLGITHQIVGRQPFSYRPFAYCGSVGPVRFSDGIQQDIARLGGCIASHFDLIGCFGIDFVVDEYNTPWLIEINPRITASAEIMELSGCIDSVVRVHVDSCCQAVIPATNEPHSIMGKAIVYSNLDEAMEISEEMSDQLIDLSLYHEPTMYPNKESFATADIPLAGTVIQSGHPIVSVFSLGSNAEEVKSKLTLAATTVQNQIKKLAYKTSAS